MKAADLGSVDLSVRCGENSYAFMAFLITLLFNIVATARYGHSESPFPPSFIIFEGVVTIGYLSVLIIPAICFVAIKCRRIMRTWSSFVVKIAVTIIATNIVWYAVFVERWTPSMAFNLSCCIAISASGATLVVLFPGGRFWPTIGCTLQFINLVTWAFPIVGELP